MEPSRLAFIRKDGGERPPMVAAEHAVCSTRGQVSFPGPLQLLSTIVCAGETTLSRVHHHVGVTMRTRTDRRTYQAGDSL